jgi:hypothetical protein
VPFQQVAAPQDGVKFQHPLAAAGHRPAGPARPFVGLVRAGPVWRRQREKPGSAGA